MTKAIACRWGLAILACLFSVVTFAQTVVTGKVTDKKGAALSGVSVSVPGGGAITDDKGSFSLPIKVRSSQVNLTFFSVGFKQVIKQVDLTKKPLEVTVVLEEDVLGLDEVIVTGTTAGTTKKQLGNYVATVKAEDLNKGAAGNVLQALQGKTAGAQISQNSGDPAGGLSVRLRGISSISGSSEPLYIVDGVIVNNGTNRVTNTQGNYDGANVVGTIGQSRMVDINPADIDRIEVLNGAAAAAIYGSRANAGVVQIFTKKGVSGAPKVSFSTSIMSSELRKKLPVNNAATKFGGPTDGPLAQTQDILTPTLTNRTNVTRYDYQDVIFRNGLGTDNNVSVSGGTATTKYFVSGSYFYNQGIIRNTDFQRYSFRSNIEQVINKWATVNVGLNYVNSAANEKPDGNSFYSPMNSVTIIGNFHNIWERNALGNLQAVGNFGRVNPISVIEDIKQRQSTNRILANAGIKLKPIKNLTIDYTMGIDNYAQVGTTFIPPFAYNVSTGFFGGGVTLDPTQNGYASTAANNFFAINHDLNATYTANINKNWTSVTQLGYSVQYERNNYQLLHGRGLAPFVQTFNAASTILPNVDDRSELSISGGFVQQNFKYRNQLFITGALRQDGSSVFAQDQRNQLYSKASGSYVLSSTDYFKNSKLSKWVDLLKVRVAYGESGNLTGIGAFERFNNYSSNSFLGRTNLNSSTVLANPNMRPERQKELEFGVDIAALNNRLGLTVNVYNKRVDDLLINRFIAPTTGFSSLRDNFGSLENKGFEIVLRGEPIVNKNFRWEVTGIFNRNRNKAINIGQSLNLLATNAGAPVAIIQGQPIGVFYGTFFATNGGPVQFDNLGLPLNTNGLVTNSLGIPQIERGTQNTSLNPLQYSTARDPNGLPTGGILRKVIGDPNPDYTTTLVNEFSYKKWSARIQLDAVHGVDVFNADYRTRQGVGNGKVAELEHNGFLPRGYISATQGIYAIEQWRIDNGSFVKLRELAISYNVGKVKGFGSINITAAGRNLLSFDNYKGYDPEVNAGGQSTLLRGIDFGAVPIPRTYQFTVQCNF
jgi:TonB-linked SusC/RagA family outer membrane protein